jgi:hypothetical protein
LHTISQLLSLIFVCSFQEIVFNLHPPQILFPLIEHRDKVIPVFHTNKSGKFLKNSKTTSGTGVQVGTEKGRDLTTSISAPKDESLSKTLYALSHTPHWSEQTLLQSY